MRFGSRIDSGEQSFINEKDVDGLTITTETDPIPEPESGALLVLGLAALAVARRWSRPLA